MWLQKEMTLKAKPRGFHLVTDEVYSNLPELSRIKTGLLHIFMQHTSASLAINENADPDVREDMEAYFSKIVPENEPYFKHTLEGSDDMPAHLKTVLLGPDLTIPVAKGRLKLGMWQGIYLCEHRNYAGARRLVLTLNGE